jgi:hypothetical protein
VADRLYPRWLAVELQELVALMTEVAESLQLPVDLDEALPRITCSAADAIPGI